MPCQCPFPSRDAPVIYCLLTIFCLSLFKDSSNALVIRDLTEVCPLSCKIMLQSLSPSLQRSFRFLRFPLPAPPQLFLRIAFQIWRRYRLTVFSLCDPVCNLGSVFPPVTLCLRRVCLHHTIRLHTFLVKHVSIFGFLTCNDGFNSSHMLAVLH